MISKIINMAEHLKDEDDRRLEQLFAIEPIADGDFSSKILRKIHRRLRRRQWIRRLSLPVAILAGSTIAAKPLLGFVAVLPAAAEKLLGATLPLAHLPLSGVLDASSILVAATALMALFVITRILEE